MAKKEFNWDNDFEILGKIEPKNEQSNENAKKPGLAKKLLATIAVIAIGVSVIFGVAACGKDNGINNNNNNNNQQTEQTLNIAAPNVTVQPGYSDDEVLVTLSAPKADGYYVLKGSEIVKNVQEGENTFPLKKDDKDSTYTAKAYLDGKESSGKTFTVPGKEQTIDQMTEKEACNEVMNILNQKVADYVIEKVSSGGTTYTFNKILNINNIDNNITLLVELDTYNSGLNGKGLVEISLDINAGNFVDLYKQINNINFSHKNRHVVYENNNVYDRMSQYLGDLDYELGQLALNETPEIIYSYSQSKDGHTQASFISQSVLYFKDSGKVFYLKTNFNQIDKTFSDSTVIKGSELSENFMKYSQEISPYTVHEFGGNPRVVSEGRGM